MITALVSLAQIAFSVRLQLLQDHGADFRRRQGLAVDDDLPVGAHVALNGNDGALRVGHSLALGHLAHQTFAVLGKGHNGRSRTRAFGVGDNSGFAAFHHGDAGIRSTQIDTNNLRHNVAS